jgi:hypothetical protein
MAETATETENTAAETAAPNTRFSLPEGKVTPIQLKNKLIQLGKTPKATQPQMFYTFVNNPGKADPFPVKHYAEDGTEYPQKGGPDGNVNTRPGLDLDEGVAWWDRRKARIAEKATATTTEASEPVPAVAEAQATEPEGADGDFHEAE